MKKPTPNVAVVSSNEAYWLSVGKKEPGDDDRQESEDNEIIPFERISNYCCGDLDRLRCGMIDGHIRSPDCHLR
jgi:hypothetical protein